MSALEGEVIVCGQHEGGDVQLRIFGDEFYARYETLSGYSVVYDIDRGQYCYAVLAGGHLVSSGISSYKTPPSGVRKHLQESNLVRALKFDQNYSTMRPDETPNEGSVTRTLGRDNGLLTGRKLHQGDIKGLTIIVNFKDVKTNISKNDVDAMMNDDNFNLNGNFSSVKKYYELMSTGKLVYNNKVVGPVELPKKRSYYISNSLVKDVVDIAVNDFNLDMSEFDSQDEGIVDAINILYAGSSQFSGSLWPHNHIKRLEYDGVRTHYYMLSGLGSNRIDLNIGTICHENGHMLCRFPDVYDYGARDNDQTKSYGLGYYCLMANGNYLNRGKTPAPFSPYLRDLAGWSEEVVSLNSAGEFTAKHGDYNRLLKFHTHLPNEYFLVENRQKKGLDKYLPSHGLAVYHCDTLGSNEWQQGSADKHFQIALLQADGRQDLENKVNRGNSGDLFKPQSGIAVSDTTNPTSRHWDETDSGLTISDIQQDGEDLVFTMGEPVFPREVFIESSPDIAIPDNDDAGVKDTLVVNGTGIIESMKMYLEILHGWSGDLHVELFAPSGESVVVYNKAKEITPDISAVYSTDNVLAPLLKQQVKGEWFLKVVDRLESDVGKLVRWSLDILLEDAKDDEIAEGESAPNLSIPDFVAKGIEDSIELEPGANALVKQVVVKVDISHDYVGDLLIKLKSPQGTQITLLSEGEIGDQSNLQHQFDQNSNPELKELLDEAAHGEWTLHVTDLAREDSGTLNSWSIQLVHDTAFG